MLPLGQYTVTEIYVAAYITWQVHLGSDHSTKLLLEYLRDSQEKKTGSVAEEDEIFEVSSTIYSETDGIDFGSCASEVLMKTPYKCPRTRLSLVGCAVQSSTTA